VVHASSGSARDSVVVILDALQLSSVSMGLNGLLCFIASDRHAYCRGGNGAGEAGSLVETAVFPVRVGGGHEFQSITAGAWHACGLTSEGRAYCWGSNHDGKVGPGMDTRVMLPQLVAADLTFRQLSAGPFHTCGITQNGAAYCWGTQWGPGSNGPSLPPTSRTPVLVEGGRSFAQIDAGFRHTCATTEDGAAYCWGANDAGQLGDNTITSSASAVAVAGNLEFRHVSAGMSHSCGVTRNGAAYCWGDEGAGSGYSGTLPPSTSPLQVALPDGVTLTMLDVGDGTTCGVTTDGSAYCWGFIWDADAVETGFPPTLLPGGIALVSMDRWCGVSPEPAVYCWGFSHPGPSISGPYRVEGQP
jgi:alpha-tubulin suppressor-like RCC1 family protein